MDELFKPCERLKLPAVIRNTATDRERPPSLHLMILEADLHLLVLKRGNLFDENCVGVQYFGNCCDYKMKTLYVSLWCSAQDV